MVLRVQNIPMYIGVTGVLTLVGYTMMGGAPSASHMDGTSGFATGRKPGSLSKIKVEAVRAPNVSITTVPVVAPAPSVTAPVASAPVLPGAAIESLPAITLPAVTPAEPAGPVAVVPTASASAAAAVPVSAVAQSPIEVAVDPFAGADVVASAATGEVVTAEDAKRFPGIDTLPQLGIPIPKLEFELDISDEAKATRTAAKIAEYEAEGLPSEVAKLKAQLVERELFGKATRAVHKRKRTIVRLIQEAKLKKDAADRAARMQLVQMKQEMGAAQMAEEAKAKEENAAQKKADREARDAKLAAEAKAVQDTKAMMAQMRLEAITKLASENAERKTADKEEKKNDRVAQEARDEAAKEEKRKMMEEFQAQMQAQLEDQKRLAREERIEEANEARAARLALEGGLQSKPLVSADDQAL
jgi:hypothetical protein